jgi:hypothetical protein
LSPRACGPPCSSSSSLAFVSQENRYRELLENSVRDALKLAEENTKLKTDLEKALKRA